MAQEDRETRIVYTDGAGVGWFIAMLALIAVAVGGFYLHNSGALAFGGHTGLANHRTEVAPQG